MPRKWKEIRRRTLANATQCHWCGVAFSDDNRATVDHIVPIKLGGTDYYKNLVPCCYKCNQAKHSLDPRDWVDRLDKEGKDRTRKIVLDSRGCVFLRDFKSGTVIQVAGKIECPECKKYVPLQDMMRFKRRCKPCNRREIARRWCERHPEKARETRRKSYAKWVKNNPEKNREKNLERAKKHYSIVSLLPGWRRSRNKQQRSRWKRYKNKINAARKERYHTDPEYRATILAKAAERWKRGRMDKDNPSSVPKM